MLHMWDSLTFTSVLAVLCHINRHNINKDEERRVESDYDVNVMCFNTSLLWLLLYNWLLFTCFVTSTKLDLRFSLALCDKEKQFRQTRRERVMLGIKKLLDMEKPRFLPSSPEEVGTSRLTIPLANLKPTHSLASSSSSHLSHAAICCSWFHWRTGWRATAAPKGSLSVCILQGELASLPASCDATLT